MATSLKLPVELKRRISRVVRDTEQTAHAFMLDAIKAETERAEKRKLFVNDALKARAETGKAGAGYAMQDVHSYILAKAAGKKARRPQLKQWRA